MPGTAETLTGEPYKPGGAARIGGASSVQPPKIQFPDKWAGMPQKPPPGVRQDVWDATISYVQTKQMPSMGFNPSVRVQIFATVPAAAHALGIEPTQIPQQWAKYGALTHAEYAAGTRAANLGFSINEAQQAAPAVIQTSGAVGRTSLGPFFNSWITGAKLQTGDPNIVAFQSALNTFLNVYARGINPTGRMTDQQQRHAYETLNTAMSQGQIETGVRQLLAELGYMKAGIEETIGEMPELVGQGQSGSAPVAGGTQPPAAPTGPALPQPMTETQAPQGTIKYDAQGNRVQ